MGNGAATPSMVLRSHKPGLQLAYIGDATAQGGRSRHRGAHQVSASSPSLASLEIAISRRGAPFSRREYIIVHRQAHRASRLTPFEAGVDQNCRHTLFLSLPAYRSGPRHDHGTHTLVHLASRDQLRDNAQILNPSVGTRTDEHTATRRPL